MVDVFHSGATPSCCSRLLFARLAGDKQLAERLTGVKEQQQLGELKKRRASVTLAISTLSD